MKPTLYLFVGYPGSGKTTIAKLIETRTSAVNLWADHVRKEMFAEPTHSREESKLLYNKLNTDTARLLRQGQSVIFDTNFNFYNDRELLRSIATNNCARSVLIWVTTPAKLARQRAVEGHQSSTTRVYGTMTTSDFERIVHNMEPPLPEEHAIKIDGTNLSVDTVYTALDL